MAKKGKRKGAVSSLFASIPLVGKALKKKATKAKKEREESLKKSQEKAKEKDR